MFSILCDVSSGTDGNRLLQRTAEVVSALLAADHVLIQQQGTNDRSWCERASIGWNQRASSQTGKIFENWSRRPESAELQEITVNGGQWQASGYIPSPAFLREQALSAGLFLTVPCGEGRLDVFAGRTRAGPAFGEKDARSLGAIVTILRLSIEREDAGAAHPGNLQRVIQAKQEWECVLDDLPQLLCLLDEQGNVIRANRVLEAWNLGELRSVRGTPVHDMLHPRCRDWQCRLKAEWKLMWQQFADLEFIECNIYDPILERDLRCSLHRGGKSRYPDGAQASGHVYLVVEDVSQHKHALHILNNYQEELEQRIQERTLDLTKANARLKSEIQNHIRDAQALRETAERYTCLMEATLTGFYVASGNQIVFCNRRFGAIFDYDCDEISRMTIEKLFPPDESDALGAPARPIEPAALLAGEQIVRGVARDGKTLWLLRHLSSVNCHGGEMILGSVIDLTKQKVVEDALRCSQCDLQVLSEKLLLTQEAERKQIAAELHDSIGQSISAVKFSVENALRECGEGLPASGRKYLTGAIEKLRDAIEEVRKISMEIRPSMLDDLGLTATIGWFCREFRTLFPHTEVDLRTEVEEGEIPASLKIVVFRILQEALNNIGKHAKASRIAIGLVRRKDLLTLEISDDGLGFAVEAASGCQGFGLGSMRERAKLSGGTLVIESAPGTGTVVRATWPCRHTSRA